MKNRKAHWIFCILIILTIILFSACSNENQEPPKTDGELSVTGAVTPSGVEQPEAEADSSTEDENAGVDETVPTSSAETDEKELVDISLSGEVLAGELVFSVGSGQYTDAFELELSYSGNAVIYYTTDGSDPATTGKAIRYTAPILITDRSEEANIVSAVDPLLFDAANCKVNGARDGFVSNLTSYEDAEVDKCTVIRAIAVDENGAASTTGTNTYFIGSMEEHLEGIAESCEAAGMSLAVISISINFDDLFDYETGIYVKGKVFDEALADFLSKGGRLQNDTGREIEANFTQRGRAWEREAHIDFIESNGAVTECVLQQDCGIRIQGNYSRSDLQKGFRLYARSDYGDNNFRYTVFGEDFTNDAGEVMDKFKVLTLRNGGNCAFTTKYSDTYWQSLVKDLACETQESRPCVVYLNGEYWGLYILQEDYTDDYFEDTHGVAKETVVLYKGDAETYEIGYKLDEGEIPEGESVSYYFNDLLNFFDTHDNLEAQEDYEAFEKLVDVQSALDYFAVELWINNKWDWPGKNWSMWKTIQVDESNPYADGRWRYCFYDMEFGGVSGSGDRKTNTIKEDNYQTYGMLDMSTSNPAVLVYAYLMTNENFRAEFAEKILSLSETNFEQTKALARLELFRDTYSPLYDQFFARYPGTGSTKNSNEGGYASSKCIADFLNGRADNIQTMLDFVDKHYAK